MKMIDIVTNRLDEIFEGDSEYQLMVVAIGGSHAYGMNNQDSDFDLVGVVIPPIEYILGTKNFEQTVIPKTVLNKSEVEGVIFSFEKWYNLVLQQNPNVIELLWHEPTQYIFKDEVLWPMIFDKRSELLSLKAKHSFSGYAHAQFQRLDKLNEKVNQNKKRLEEFEKFGYSVKNATHMLRLMNTCLEILVEHKIQVMRPERQQLIAIREGAYTLDQLRELADKKEALIEEAYIKSSLRHSVDEKMASDLKIKVLQRFLKE